MYLIPLRNSLLTISFFVLTIPDCNPHRSFSGFELRVISIVIYQGSFENN
jgi:hypothetical protein